MYLVLTPAVPPGASSYLRLGCQWYRNDPLGYVIDRRLCDGRRKGSLFGYDDLSLPVHSIHAISHSPDRCAAKGVSLLHPSAGRAGRHVFSDRARDAHNDADEHELPAAVYQMAGQFSVDPCVLRSTFGGLRSFTSHSLPCRRGRERVEARRSNYLRCFFYRGWHEWATGHNVWGVCRVYSRTYYRMFQSIANTTAKRTACATTYLCDVASRGRCAPVATGVADAPADVVEAVPVALDTSRTTGPAPSGACGRRAASAAALPGFVVPNAQMRFCESPAWVCRTGVRSTALPGTRAYGDGERERWERSERLDRRVVSGGQSSAVVWRTCAWVLSAVATRGGLATTVGGISAVACRCESVTLPSSFAHRMTIGELAMVEPNPLVRCTEHGARAQVWMGTHMAIQPGFDDTADNSSARSQSLARRGKGKTGAQSVDVEFTVAEIHMS